MKRNDDTIGADRAGGTSRRSGNPPAISVSRAEEFTPGSTPPEPLLPAQLKDMVVRDGFSDGDTPQVESILNRISYQHLSEYYRIAKSEHAPGDAGYKLVHRIALFDRKLQSVLMEGIGLFELQFRAQYSYALGASHGAFAHRSSGNFKDIGHYRSSMSKYFTEVERQISRKNASVLREQIGFSSIVKPCKQERAGHRLFSDFPPFVFSALFSKKARMRPESSR